MLQRLLPLFYPSLKSHHAELFPSNLLSFKTRLLEGRRPRIAKTSTQYKLIQIPIGFEIYELILLISLSCADIECALHKSLSFTVPFLLTCLLTLYMYIYLF